MEAEQFEDRLSRLLASLDEAAALVRAHGASHWAEWLEADRRRISRGDRVGLDHFLQAFGGMGSLNDLVLHPGDDDAGEASAADCDERLDLLRATMFADASALRRSLVARRWEATGGAGSVEASG